MNILVESNDLI